MDVEEYENYTQILQKFRMRSEKRRSEVWRSNTRPFSLFMLDKPVYVKSVLLKVSVKEVFSANTKHRPAFSKMEKNFSPGNHRTLKTNMIPKSQSVTTIIYGLKLRCCYTLTK